MGFYDRSRLLNSKFISYTVGGTLSSDGDFPTGHYWNDVIPLRFEPIDRTGWLWSPVYKSDGQIYVCGHGTNSIATGSVSGYLHCIKK